MKPSSSSNKIGEMSVEDYAKDGLAGLVEATKTVNAFPSGTSRLLYGAHPTFSKVVDNHSERLINMISGIMKKQKLRGNIERRRKEDKFELILECNDVMLERISSNLDEIAGLKKVPETVLVETQISSTSNVLKGCGSWNLKTNSTTQTQKTFSPAAAKLITAKNIARPQVNFKIPVDNSSSAPFEPRIKEKPNSLKPLAVLPEYDDDGNVVSYLHPYEFELDKFEPPNSQLKRTEPTLPKAMADTEYIYVDSEEGLKNLLEDLRQQSEFAVDLEHHSYRTFQGITCLMQISTREKDYVIDTLKLRDELYILNDVFTAPKILKVFHGAEMDIEWLQRDLSLYVVNMFDTHEAAKILGYARLSLAYLLKHYCGIEADKTLRIADWRMRPLPEELIAYARQDTHYLLYIYENMRNELLDKKNSDLQLIKAVYDASRDICKKRYQKPRIFSDSHLDIYRKSKAVFDNRQLFALKDIFTWRDKIAREEDESYGYVLPNHMMLVIAENLPREMQGILACCNPIPPLVRQNLHILHQIILEARRQPLVKPIIEERVVHRVVRASNKDFNSKLLCPHDFSHADEFRNDLPTLLGKSLQNGIDAELSQVSPKLSVFEQNKEPENHSKKIVILNKVMFVSPYERYKAVVPIVEKEKLDTIMKEDAAKKPILVEEEEKPVEVIEKPAQPITDDKLSIKRKIESDASEDEPEQKKKKYRKGKGKSQIIDKRQLNNDEDEEETLVDDDVEPVAEIDEEKDWSSNDGEMKNRYNFESSSEDEVNEGDKDKLKPLRIRLPGTSGKKGAKKSRKRKGKALPRMKTGQKSDEPVAFDYSTVDYSKFQGGTAKKRQEGFKSKFQTKTGNKSDMKKFNKLFTFSKVGKGKKS